MTPAEKAIAVAKDRLSTQPGDEAKVYALVAVADSLQRVANAITELARQAARAVDRMGRR